MASGGVPPLRIGDWSSPPRIMCPSAYPPHPASARTTLRPRRRGCPAAPPDDREPRSAKDVSGRGEEDARTAGLAPDTLIRGAGLPPVLVPRIELLVVDHQPAVQQIQLFDAGMTMGRILGSRREPYEHADAAFLGIRCEELAGDARRPFFPFRFRHSERRRHYRRRARLGRDSLRKALPQRCRWAQHIGWPGGEGADDGTKRFQLLPAIRTRGDMSLHDETFARRKGLQGVQEHRFQAVPIVVARS